MDDIKIIKFSNIYAQAVSQLIIRNFMEVNIKDYSLEEMQALSQKFTPGDIISYSKWRYIMVALQDDVPVGTIGITMLPPNNKQGEYWILSVFVLPEYHGRGIGCALMESIEEYAKQIGAKKLIVPSSITASDFYYNLGYRYKNDKKVLNSDGLYLMEKIV